MNAAASPETLRDTRRALLAGLRPQPEIHVSTLRLCAVVHYRATAETKREELERDIAKLAPGADIICVGPPRSSLHGGNVWTFDIYPAEPAAGLPGGPRELSFGSAA